VRLSDLEERLGPEKAKAIMEQIWIAEHPGAVRVLKVQFTVEHLDQAQRYVSGQLIGAGKVGLLFNVFRKAFLVDERVKEAMLAFIAEEQQALTGSPNGEAPLSAMKFDKRGHRLSKRRPLSAEQREQMSKISKKRWAEARKRGLKPTRLPKGINGK
jgi:hypothetical protein